MPRSYTMLNIISEYYVFSIQKDTYVILLINVIKLYSLFIQFTETILNSVRKYMNNRKTLVSLIFPDKIPVINFLISAQFIYFNLLYYTFNKIIYIYIFSLFDLFFFKSSFIRKNTINLKTTFCVVNDVEHYPCFKLLV